MSPIDVGDDDAEIPSAQPDPVDVAEESVRGYIEAEPGRQYSGFFSDDGGSGAPLAADSVDAQLVLIQQIRWEGHVSDSADSVSAIGVGADADGLWAANSVGPVEPAGFPLTQAYEDERVNHEDVAGPYADMPPLRACHYEDEPACTRPACLSPSLVCSEVESSASTAAPTRCSLLSATYFPSFNSLPVARCQKCGREVDSLKTRQTRREEMMENARCSFQARGL